MAQMKTHNSTHSHTFGQDRLLAGERRTLVVVLITTATMVIEILGGLAFGSMALLADGLHMASHAVALGLTFVAYRIARKRAADPRFSFGTGKVNALGGYTGAVLLGVFALGMAVESVSRYFSPVPIAFNQALGVAILGLVVNGMSVLLLGTGHRHDTDGHHPGETHHDHASQDHNLRSAYLHVIADSLTSVLAIVALLVAKYWHQEWLDPCMGIVGALLVTRWACGLLGQTGKVLLDFQCGETQLEKVRTAVESPGGVEIVDLHIWSIGTGIRAAILAVVLSEPITLQDLRNRVPSDLGIVHLTIEVDHSG